MAGNSILKPNFKVFIDKTKLDSFELALKFINKLDKVLKTYESNLWKQ